MKSYLSFEKDIKVLEEELEKLKDPYNKEGISEVNTAKISEIQAEIDEKLKRSDHVVWTDGPIEAQAAQWDALLSSWDVLA